MSEKADQHDYLQFFLKARRLLEENDSKNDSHHLLIELTRLIRNDLPADSCAIYFCNSQGALVSTASTGQYEWPSSIDDDVLKTLAGAAGISINQIRDQDGLAGCILALPQNAGVFTSEQNTALQELASLLLEISRIESEERATCSQGPAGITVMQGKPISSGIAKGRVELHGAYDQLLAQCFVEELDPEMGAEQFELALSKTRESIMLSSSSIEKELPEIASLIFSAQLMMLDSPRFSGSIRELISQGDHPCDAILTVGSKLLEAFGQSSMLGIREKISDIKDLSRRLLYNLLQLQGKQEQLYGDIIVTNDLCPSDIIRLRADGVRGLVMVGAGSSGHSVIVASSLGLTVVSVDEKQAEKIIDGHWAEVDGTAGTIKLCASGKVETVDSGKAVREQVVRAKPSTCTSDGCSIHLHANVNLLRDADLAAEAGAEGIGLYRTEFPFMVGDQLPSKEKQQVIYRSLIDIMNGNEVIMRTLDVGRDKSLPYMDDSQEFNPLLGVHGIRFCFHHDEIFREQLMAILKAGAHTSKLGIMFPLIASLEDFRKARGILHECLDFLDNSGIEHCKSPMVGMMAELPSVIPLIGEFAQEADFISVGTNDLVQYLMAADRTNPHVEKYRHNHHPAVLRSLAAIASGVKKYDTVLSVCGEMAGDIRYTAFLLGIGIRKLSVVPRAIPILQKHIEKLNLDECEELASKMLQETTIADVEKYLISK